MEGEAVLWRPPLPPARSSPLSFSGDGVEGIGAAAYDALDAANGACFLVHPLLKHWSGCCFAAQRFTMPQS